MKKLKQSGRKVGDLKLKRFVNSIPLKGYSIIYKLDFSRNRTKIQRLGDFRVLDLHQIPFDAEIANAVLVKRASGYYLHVTPYLPMEDFYYEPLADAVGIDFEVHETKGLKRLRKRLAQTKNREKILAERGKKQKEVRIIEKSQMIAVCGLNCSGCDIFRASDNPEIAQRIVNWFKEEKHMDVKIEDIHCLGCREDRTKHWSPDCWILRCCVDKKGLEFCYQCKDFPCEKLSEWAKENEKYKKALNQLKEMGKR